VAAGLPQVADAAIIGEIGEAGDRSQRRTGETTDQQPEGRPGPEAAGRQQVVRSAINTR
jgi:hypothetical protein